MHPLHIAYRQISKLTVLTPILLLQLSRLGRAPMGQATRVQTPLGRFEKGSKNRPAQKGLGSHIVAGLDKIGLSKKRWVSKRLWVVGWCLLIVYFWVVVVGRGRRAVCCKLLADCWSYMKGWGLVVIGVLVAVRAMGYGCWVVQRIQARPCGASHNNGGDP